MAMAPDALAKNIGGGVIEFLSFAPEAQKEISLAHVYQKFGGTFEN